MNNESTGAIVLQMGNSTGSSGDIVLHTGCFNPYYCEYDRYRCIGINEDEINILKEKKLTKMCSI